jgi:hypothetical protein
VKFSKNVFIVWLCVLVLFTQVLPVSAAERTGITVREPQVLSSPEENIPVAEKAPSDEKGGGKWLWALLGVALIGGVAAAAGGGGGGGGDGNGEDTGSIVITGPAP